MSGRCGKVAHGLMIRRSQVQVLPAPPIYLRFRAAGPEWQQAASFAGTGASLGHVRELAGD